MGILDFLRRGKNKEQENRQVVDNMPKQSLSLKYHSGQSVDVVFGDNVQIDGKTLKKAVIWYWPEMGDAATVGKDVLLEPHTKIIDNRVYENTYEYYYNLIQSGKMGAVKGFFQQEQVKKRPTNYLGELNFDSEGTPFRREDTEFVEKYKEKCEREEEAKRQADFSKKIAKDNKTLEEIGKYDLPEDEEPTIYGENDIRRKLMKNNDFSRWGVIWNTKAKKVKKN